MDWTAGYVSDIEYTAGFYAEQAPGYLNLVCALNGYEPPALSGKFTCFELGFGRGLTANALAASNPQGTFYANDFNPAHVAGARALAATAQLTNLTLLENSFAELAQGKVDLPQFDYITLHGIYTWVSPENRAHIVDFIDRYLKPGGAAYVSYNAMPGWTGVLPLQRLLREYGDAFPSPDAGIGQAAAFVERLGAASSGYINGHPTLKPRLETLKSGSVNYLAHEYLNRSWEPLYHVDVARGLAGAKMEFVGSAVLPMAYPALYLSPERQAVIDTFPDGAMRETLKDYLFDTSFRKDVFVRGARKMGQVRQAELLEKVGVVLTVPRANVDLQLKTPVGTFNGLPELYGAVCDALAQRPHTVGELTALPALRAYNLNSVMQVAVLLAASGQAAIYLHGGAKPEAATTQKMNAALVDRLRYANDFHVLCSPLLGNGIAADLFDRLVYGVLAQKKGTVYIDALLRQVWERMRAIGRNMVRDGVTLLDEDDNLAALRPVVEAIVRDKVPLWQQLKLL